MDYLDLKITIEHFNEQTYRVSARSRQRGESKTESSNFPYSNAQLPQQLNRIANVLYKVGTRGIGGRRSAAEKPLTAKDVEAFGGELFEFVFTGEVLEQFRSLLAIATNEGAGTGVRVRLTFTENAAQIATAPWELMFDAKEDSYVCLKHKSALLRYLNVSRPIEELTVPKPLKILGMMSNPLNDLQVSEEKTRIDNALKPLVDSNQIELKWVEGDTIIALHRAMSQGDWHIFHYIGHADFDDEKKEGFLLLGDGVGGVKNLYADDFKLLDKKNMRMIVLNACNGAEGANDDLFSSTASTLIRDGIQAVLAMQYPITDTAALSFAQTFYSNVAAGRPIDYALADGRVLIKLLGSGDLEWATPVLFMRSEDGRLFEAGDDTQAPTTADDQAKLHNQNKPKPEPPVMTSTETISVDKMQITNFLKDSFNINELKDICFAIDIEPENLGTSSQSGMVRELVKFLMRRKKMPLLLTHLTDEHRELLETEFGPFGQLTFKR